MLFKVGEIIACLYTDENALLEREELLIETEVEMLEQCSRTDERGVHSGNIGLG